MNKFFLFLLLSFLVAAKPAYAGDIRIPAKGGGLYQVVIVDKGTEGAKYDGKTESIINTSWERGYVLEILISGMQGMVCITGLWWNTRTPEIARTASLIFI